jgi:hypothetical protein
MIRLNTTTLILKLSFSLSGYHSRMTHQHHSSSQQNKTNILQSRTLSTSNFIETAKSTQKRKTQSNVANLADENKNKKQKTEAPSKVDGSILSFFSKEQKSPPKSSLGVIVNSFSSHFLS